MFLYVLRSCDQLTKKTNKKQTNKRLITWSAKVVIMSDKSNELRQKAVQSLLSLKLASLPGIGRATAEDKLVIKECSSCIVSGLVIFAGEQPVNPHGVECLNLDVGSHQPS